jgi:hypothetical protein
MQIEIMEVLVFSMEVLEKGNRKDRARFRPGRSCVDQINTLIKIEQLAEK